MQDLVFSFLCGVLGRDGASALKKASLREPELEQLLVPRAALAWIQQRRYYEGRIPGVDNSYLRFQKHGNTYEGSVSCGDTSYGFSGAGLLHVAAALSVASGVSSTNIRPIQDRHLVRLGKSIDALVKAQELFRDDLRKSVFEKVVLDPSLGYKISHKDVDLGDGETWTQVSAHDREGNHVGGAMLEHKQGGTTMLPKDVDVHPQHRRLGLASAMYAHAEKHIGKKVVPSPAQTRLGQALWSGNDKAPQFGKIELPGQTAKPQKQQGPAVAAPPQKQPQGGKPVQPKLPRAPKMPALKVEKTEMERPCPDCGSSLFKNQRFVGCVCYSTLVKHIRTTVYGDGCVLEFGTGIDRDSARSIIQVLKWST